MPGWFKTSWSNKVQVLQQQKGLDAFPSFDNFVKEVTFHAGRMNIPQIAYSSSATIDKSKGTSSNSSSKANTHTSSFRRYQTTTLATKLETNQANPPTIRCKFHNTSTHDLMSCQKFQEQPYQQKRDFLYKNKLCFNCLCSDHVAKECKRPAAACDICKEKHLTLLHKPKQEDETQMKKEKESNNACTKICGSPGVSRSCARIVLVEVSHDSPQHPKTLAYAVLDDQSTDVFVTTSLLDRLAVTGEDVNLQVNTIVGTNTIRTEKLLGLKIQDVDHRHNPIKVPYAYKRDDIPASHNDIATPVIAEQWNHLRPIKERVKYHPDVDIGMLIGRNVPTAFQPINIIYGGTDEPWAEEYKFGWTIIGNVCPSEPNHKESTASVYHLSTREEVESPQSIVGKAKDTTSPLQLRQMMELDYNELHYSRQVQGSEKTESQDDKHFREIMETKIHRNDKGNWEAPLPFSTDDISLPDNRQQCLRRLLSLKRRLSKDQHLKESYLQFMWKIFDKGHASRVPAEQLTTQPGKVWYLPHFDVYHPRKPDQIRVVFDCSALHEGESLNKNLLQGPDLMNALVGVLLRFRKESVAFMCDVEQMFHSFFVDEDNRDFLRFLWFEGNDLDAPIVDCRMNVHLFGALSSPGVANFCLQETARSGRQEFGDDAANFLLHDFYVDDGLKSVPTVDDAIQLIKSSQAMCASKNLRLHKFASNNKCVLEELPPEDRAKDLKDLDLRYDTLPIQRSLGTYWCIESDTLGFRIQLKDKPLTRRGILSTTSSVYDPLGVVSPVILVSKQILQSLCRQGISWDDPVPDEIAARWEKWRSELPLLENVKVDRCVKPPSFGPPTKAEVHSFSDASDNGLGQVSYLRLVNAADEVHVSFLMAKSRVAPLKAISIPRMELTAAVISTNVTNMLKSELGYHDLNCAYYTDSEIVINYINNNARRFHVYVGNRVQYIRDHTDPKQWHHVKGKDNPADEASRSMSAKELLNNQRWLRGPEFLWEADVPLTSETSSSFKLKEDDAEVKVCEDDVQATSLITKNKRCTSTPVQFPSALQYISRFSTWFKAKSWIAAIRRGINLWKSKCTTSTIERPCADKEEQHSKVEELREAEAIIIKNLQKEHFSEELAIIKKLRGNLNQFESRQDARNRNVQLKSKSSLFRLDPFVDERGLLRVGGRLALIDEPLNTKHPLILPQNSHVTSLIIDHYHRTVTQHQGRSTTLNALRQSGFWVTNGRSAVSSHITKCVTCRKQRGKLHTQKMADLPQERITPAAPFTYTGMDVFGPFYIKEGRKTLKRYGLIFTCLSSRAVHLETLNSMETDSFINALRRFLNRRGKVRVLKSDQGTNFVGAKNEFDAANTELNTDKIKQFLLKNECEFVEFKFNVPYASHMGGVWERMIRSVRSVLTSLLNHLGCQLDDESFRTLMTEAESIINNRPLTIQDLSNPDAEEPLTPNHLLTGKSSTVFPPPGNFEEPDVYSRKRWRRVQYLSDQFWFRWRKEYLNQLNSRPKWTGPKRNCQVGDVVLLKDDAPRNRWPLARISKVLPSKDGLVRKVEVRTSKEAKVYQRPIHRLVLVLPKEEQ